ncbi:MAG: tetratricopeptide repeat protein [Chitinophagales bacterium]
MKNSKKSHNIPSKKKTIAQHSKERKWAVGILLLITFLVYLPSLQNGFVTWDDNTYVYENEHLINMDVATMLTEPMAHNYHPLTMLSLAANYAVSGFEPFGYHFTNLLLHLLNTLLVFWLLYTLTKRNVFIAFIAALLFGIHPMHIESVAWVSERKDLLYTLFFLPALLTYIRYIKTRQMGFYVATLVLFVLSLLSKPAAVIFPIVLFAFDFWYKRRWSVKLLVEKLPFLILAFGIGLYTVKIQNNLDAVASISQYSFIERILFAAYGFNFYLLKFFVPYPLLPFYAHPTPNMGLPIVYWLSPLVLLGIWATIFVVWRRSKVMVFGMAFYLLNLLLVLQLVTIGGAVVAERYTYMPYIGLGLILAYWWKRWISCYPSHKQIINGVLGVWLLLLGVYSFQHLKVWKSGETLWGYQVQQKPKGEKGLVNMGVYYIEEYKKSRTNRQLIDKALQYFNEALKYHPNDPHALNERAGVYFELQDIERGFNDVNLLIEVDPSYYQAYLNRAILYSISNNHAAAVKDYTQYLKKKTEDDRAYNWRGISYLQLQNFDKALTDFNKAIKLKPTVGEYFFNRGKANAALGKDGQAQQDMQRAKALGFVVPN